MRVLKGDTLIEVLFAIAVFSFVSVLTIVVMSDSIKTAQGNLEITMVRAEIDSQSEAIRFIHNSFLSEREYVGSEQIYRNLWKRLTDDSVTGGLSNDASKAPALNYNSCAEAYDNSRPNSIGNVNGFIVNTRFVDPGNVGRTIVAYDANVFKMAVINPRVIYKRLNTASDQESDALTSGQQYREIYRAEGIWDVAIASASRTYSNAPDFYDFHIRTCWYAPGNTNPSTIGTIIRLYNPELVVEIKR